MVRWVLIMMATAALWWAPAAAAGTAEVIPLSVDCPTAAVCHAVSYRSDNREGGYHAVTRDGGRTWRNRPIALAGIGQLHQISCPTADVCVAAGSRGVNSHTGSSAYIAIRTTDGGRSWEERALPVPDDTTTGSLSCPAADRCVIATSRGAVVSTDGGETWTLTFKFRARGFPMVQCPTQKVCWIVDTRTYRSVDGGTTWKNVGQFRPQQTRAFACLSASECLVTGMPRGENQGAVFRSSDRGRTWQTTRFYEDIDDEPPHDVACAGSTCVIVTQSIQPPVHHSRVLVTHDRGRTWRQAGRTSFGYPHAVSCPTARRCVALGGLLQKHTFRIAAAFTRNGAKSWTTASVTS
ncbi:MAG TPA: hypothetical protein VNS09_04220 [Solirubrobacter sp.]|nr:hypothetical protein [Solirubrobacter sp.]